MKALIFSDSHGNMENLDNVIGAYPTFEYIFGLGDYGVSTFDLEVRGITGVKGNNFMDPVSWEDDMIFEYGGFRFLFTHGHKHSVRSGVGGLHSYCLKNNINICFYGHTHEAKISSIDNIYFINPGSCGIPFIPSFSTVCLLEVKNKVADIEIIDTDFFTTYSKIRIEKHD